MRLILTRHGETEENQQQLLQGHLPGVLSTTGKAQAKKVAERLKDEQLNIIYSSDLARTADTAKAIATYHPGTPLIFTTALRERYFSSWQGKPNALLKQQDLPRPADIETREAMYARAEQFIAMLKETHQDETVLIAGHEGINKALISVIEQRGPAGIPLTEHIKNTSITIYELKENAPARTVLFNCTRHLA